MIRIRRAKQDDLDWMVGELKLFSAFYDSKKPLFGHEGFVREGMTGMMKNHLVLVAERDGLEGGDYRPVGFIAGLLVQHIFNPLIRCLSETFWWVEEKHRTSRAGFMLLQAFIEFGKQNADWILCTIEENSPIGPDALLARGFKLKEKNFVMEVN
jgi:hypothetical protein